MIDTVALMLPEHLYKLHKPERFNPHGHALKSPTFRNGVAKAIYNPTKAEKATGYKPRLTLIRRPSRDIMTGVMLRVEFSAPKLVFGNNFEELRGHDDFPRVIDTLHAALADMGVEVSKETLMAAKVSAIHYSKNILLGRTTPCFLLIQALEKLDLPQKLDLTQTDFRNKGQMVKYHSNSYEIALYDKVKDLEQATKYGDRRGAETDYACQTDLLNDSPQKPEVLRFEVRLHSRKLKSILKTLQQDKEPVFNDLFRVGVARDVLLHYWEQITSGLPLMLVDASDTASLIQSIRTVFPRKRPQTVMVMMGFIMASQQIGIRGAALALGLKRPQVYRLKKDLKALEAQSLNPRFSVLNAAKQEILAFIPVTRQDIAVKGLLA